MKVRDLLMIAALVGANSAFVAPVSYGAATVVQDQGGAPADSGDMGDKKSKKGKKGGKKGGKKSDKQDDKKSD